MLRVMLQRRLDFDAEPDLDREQDDEANRERALESLARRQVAARERSKREHLNPYARAAGEEQGDGVDGGGWRRAPRLALPDRNYATNNATHNARVKKTWARGKMKASIVTYVSKKLDDLRFVGRCTRTCAEVSGAFASVFIPAGSAAILTQNLILKVCDSRHSGSF